MTAELFDRHLRAIRRDRAARTGTDMFLLDRAFDECLDRLRDVPRGFDRALLLGCPSPDWPSRLAAVARQIDIRDPGGMFATAAGGQQVEEDRHDFGIDQYDLCIAVGTLNTVNDLPVALSLIGRCLRPDAPFIGAMAGGNTLPALRSSLIEAGRRRGKITARTHPRIEPASLARLLSDAGFAMPVVDVDRVRLRYKSLEALVGDLRSMAATSVLAERPSPIAKQEFEAISDAFLAQAIDGRTEEIVEILHFLGWAK